MRRGADYLIISEGVVGTIVAGELVGANKKVKE